jgi:acetylglutamate synthase
LRQVARWDILTQITSGASIAARVSKKNEEDLTHHTNSLFTLQYIELSSLHWDPLAQPMARTCLKQQLKRRYGANQITRWDRVEHFISAGSIRDHADLEDLMTAVADNSQLLERHCLDVLVIDTVRALPNKALHKFSADVERLWQSGVEIMLYTGVEPVFFEDMKNLVSNNNFVQIYIKSMWMDHQSREYRQLTTHANTSFRQVGIKPR